MCRQLHVRHAPLAFDVTASILDPYFVNPWLMTQSLTNYSANTDTTTCLLRALRWTICKGRRHGSSPVTQGFSINVWGQPGGVTQANTYVHLLRQTSNWNNPRSEEEEGSRAGSCVLQTHTSVIKRWARMVRRGFYVKQASPPPPPRAKLAPGADPAPGIRPCCSTLRALSSHNDKINTFFIVIAILV